MHTEKEFIVKTIMTARECIAKRDELLGILDPKFTNGEVITHAEQSVEYQNWLDDEDKELTPSAKGRRALRWCRKILNGNSNKKLYKLGLVKSAKKLKGKKKNHGMVLTNDGMNLSEPELIKLVHRKKPTANRKKKLCRLRGLHTPSVPSVKIAEEVPTTKSRYHDKQSVKVDAHERSGGYCETCLKKLPPHINGGNIHQVHHMFDENSKDVDILSKVRYDDISNTICVCGWCHPILHQSPNRTKLNFNAAKKIKTVNKLIDECATPEEIRTAQQKKIISL